MTHVAVLLTCHNRRDDTLACLDTLAAQDTSAATTCHLVDAGSTDGTAAAVREAHPDVHVHEAGADLFWNAGMRAAWQAAIDAGGADAYLWLNDDTRLDPSALSRLLAAWRGADGDPIVVGAVTDPETDALSYSGVVRTDPRRPLRFTRAAPGETARPVDTMNGNCVLVPAAVVERIGVLDPTFAHGMGDYDYGLRARAAGIEVLLAPGTVGTCPANTKDGGSRTVREELRHLRSQHGIPPRDWATFARRWAGPLWPVYWASPYVRRLARRAMGRAG